MSIGKLSTEEKALLDAVEGGEFESVLTESRRKELKAIASNTFKKDKRINIRISNRDLTAIQSRASEEGIPYQTLVSSIIHKYISGSLQDITANKKIQPTQKTRDWFNLETMNVLLQIVPVSNQLDIRYLFPAWSNTTNKCSLITDTANLLYDFFDLYKYC